MKHDIATANDLTRGQESAILLKIAKQTGIPDLERAARAYLRGSFELVKVKIFDVVGATTISATTEKFVAKEKFREDSREVKFNRLYRTFWSDFLAGPGKIEEPIGEQTLRYGNLTKDANTLFAEVETLVQSGRNNAAITLTELYILLKRQAYGEKGGDLLTNGRANLFCICSSSGELRAVAVYWLYGWRIGVFDIKCQSIWNAGNRVFYRAA